MIGVMLEMLVKSLSMLVESMMLGLTLMLSVAPVVLLTFDSWMTSIEISTTLLMERAAVMWTASAVPRRILTNCGGGVSITTPKSTGVK